MTRRRYARWSPGALAAACTLLAACAPLPPSGGDCAAQLLPGDLVITEVFADFKAPLGGSGTDAGKEWFEIYNAKGTPVDLEGVSITHARIDGSKPSVHRISASVAPTAIAAGQYLVLGNASSAALPDYVSYGYGRDLGDLYNTGGGKLVLTCGSAEIDAAVYEHVVEGHARALTSAQRPDYTRNDEPASWCQANDTETETGNFGTPGAENDCRAIAAGQCNDHGTMRDVDAPGPGDLVITEVMPSPQRVDDETGEWFEAWVARDVDLNGLGLDREADRAVPDIVASPDCIRVEAGSYVVFARASKPPSDPATNGGLPAASIAGTFTFSLVAGSAAAPGDVALVLGATRIDAVSWTRSTTGAALQLDPGRVDADANDIASNVCDATLPYGPAAPSPDLGTPGAANAPCASLPTVGMCSDGGMTRAIQSPRPGQLVISEVLANPEKAPAGNPATDAQREWFEVANTGSTAFDLNELSVGRIGNDGTAIQSADCLPVRPGEFAVLARSNDPTANGMLPAVAATFRFGLVDTNGDIQVSAGGTVLDAVAWRSVASGISSQLDPAHLSATDNDDPAHFCASAARYGDQTNRGSPGAANVRCP